MPAWVFNWWTKLRSSLWLIPSCMAFAAFLLSLAVPYLDQMLSSQAIDSLRWLSNMGPEGAMSLLSTIAGSMITIAGVVFSMTIVALALASSQFGPRLLGVLIYFMHHIAVSIQAPNLIAVVYAALEDGLARLFPERLGKEKEEEKDKTSENIHLVMEKMKKEGPEIRAETVGYLQAIERDKLIEIACQKN